MRRYGSFFLAGTTAMLLACAAQRSAGEALYPYEDPAGKGVGYANKQGEIVIQPRFARGWAFAHDVAPVMESEGVWSFIDREGKRVLAADAIVPVLERQWTETVEGLPPNAVFYFQKDGKWGVVSGTGEVLVEPILEAADGMPPYFGSGLMRAGPYRSYYFVNVRGEKVIPGPFDHAGDFIHGLAAARMSEGSGSGIIDTSGEFVIPPSHTLCRPVGNGLVFVSVDRSSRLVKPKGLGIIGTLMSYETDAVHQRFVVDRKGDLVFRCPQGTDSLMGGGSVTHGLIVLTMAGGRNGLIDAAGNVVLEPAKREIIRVLDDKTVLITVPGPEKFGEGMPFRFGLMDTAGNTIIEPTTITGWWTYEGDVFVAGVGGKLDMSGITGQKFGLINRKGKWLVEPTFDMFHLPFADGAIMATLRGPGGKGVEKNVLFDTSGKILAEVP